MKRSLRSWLWRVPIAEEVDEEVALHIELRTREFTARGMDPAAARELAVARLGDVRRLKRTCVDIGRKRDREMRLTQWLEELRDDLRLAARQLKAAPAFTFVAALTLALGIGANAAVFGVLKAVLIDALPYADADALVRVYSRRIDGSQERGPLSAGTIKDLAERQSSFGALAAFVDLAADAAYGSDDGAQMVTVAWVTPPFFDVLGVSSFRGRLLRDEDATSGMVPLSGGQVGQDTAGSVLLTHGSWQRLFGADDGVIGRQVRINGVVRTVVGVLPRAFVGPMGNTDFYLAFDPGPVLADPIAARGAGWLSVVARLKPGRTHEGARREMETIGADLAREYPRDNGSFAMTALPLHDALAGTTRTPLLVLMSSAALVLLIACANLAGALLSRALSRRREFAVRMALGAARSRLVRQLLTETISLAAVGGAAGLLLAVFLLDLLNGLSLPVIPAYADLSVDAGVLLVTSLVALATGVVFGIAPALAAAEPQLALRDGSRGLSESRRSGQSRGLLVAGQMALCISLLVGAGLLARSLWAMSNASLGFDPQGVLTAGVRLPLRDYATPQARAQFLRQFSDGLRAIPGVDSMALTTSIPTAVRQRLGLNIDGLPAPANAQPVVLSAVVSENYFKTLRIPVRRGRIFDARDRPDAPPTVVISESAARRLWGSRDPLGTRVRLGANPDGPLIEVVGVVGDVRNDRSRPDAEAMIYRSTGQVAPSGIQVLLRTGGDPLALTPAVERTLAAIDQGLPLQRAMTLSEVAGAGLAARRLPVLLMTAFGALALLLASVGVYAMFASMAAAREREFGVRMALGSRRSAIAGLVLRQGAIWMGAGLAVGAIGVVLVVRLVGDLLYGVRPFDPLTLGASTAILIGCATCALLIPIHRATRVDPAIVLREQ